MTHFLERLTMSSTTMRTLKYYVASSLDGFIARNDGSLDFFLMEGPHVTNFLRSLSTFDTVLMRRKTYEVGLKSGVTNPYPNMQSYVFSRTLRESPDINIKLVTKDISNFVYNLKNQPGKSIWLCGGASLAKELFDNNLIDEVIVKINPVLIGSGIPLLSGISERIDLTLKAHKIYDNSIAVLHYTLKR